MASNKYKHLAESGNASVERGKPFRKPAKSILIVCEGEVTEPKYFELIKNSKASPSVHIECHGEGVNDARNLADYALQLKSKRNKGKCRYGILEATKFDEIWIVFDADYYLKDHRNRFHRLTEGVAYAREHKIRVALSNPCFEFWLLLHFQYTTSPMSDCGEVIGRINATKMMDRTLGRDGLKGEQIAMELLPLFVERVETAVMNAEKLRRHHETSCSEYPQTPSTDVDHLICSISQTIPPAHGSLCKKSR